MKSWPITSRALNHIQEKSEDSGRQMVTFGFIMLINFPLYYLIWVFTNSASYENLPFRISASFLCLILLLKDFWPIKLRPLLPLFWHFTILYCLPFFFALMTLENHGATLWLMNMVTVTFFMLLLLDTVSFFVISFLGFILGWLFFLVFSEPFYYDPGVVNLSGVGATFLAAIIIGGIFSHNNHLLEMQRLNTMKNLGAIMAHELRTPLAAIGVGMKAANKYFPDLLDAHKIAQEKKLPVRPMSDKAYALLFKVFKSCESEVQYSNTVINMILMNAKEKVIGKEAFDVVDIDRCVQETLERYPFKTNYRELVSYNSANSFKFNGEQSLFANVLFNLLKNALYFIEAEGKGDIWIWLGYDEKEKCNVLFFKDTAKGIAPADISKLFKRFHTTTHHGTGLGLSYCKMVMESFGGDIRCTSVLGEFTQFELRFPKVD